MLVCVLSYKSIKGDKLISKKLGLLISKKKSLYATSFIYTWGSPPFSRINLQRDLARQEVRHRNNIEHFSLNPQRYIISLYQIYNWWHQAQNLSEVKG